VKEKKSDLDPTQGERVSTTTERDCTWNVLPDKSITPSSLDIMAFS
jgi:hypothetical protein